MMTVWQALGLMVGGVAVAIVCILVGGWVVFKSKTAVPGQPFIGRPPKGEVFTIPDPDAEEFPEDQEAEKKILERTGEFLKKLGGGKNDE